MSERSFRNWWKSGSPWIWLNAGAVSISILSVIGLLVLIAVRGLAHFWPSDIVQFQYLDGGTGPGQRVFGEFVESESVLVERLRSAGLKLETDAHEVVRHLVKVGNRDMLGSDFTYVVEPWIRSRETPENLVAVERQEWGNQYGYLLSVSENGEVVAEGAGAWDEFQRRIERALQLREEIEEIQQDRIGAINYELEQLRLEERGLELDNALTPEQQARIEARRAELQARYEVLQRQLGELYTRMNRDSYTLEIQDGRTVTESVAQVVRAYRPNMMGVVDKLGFYFLKLWEFVSEQPREANTEGGVFPAIFGTVLMVLIMSVIVTPMGVVAAVYMREYARQGLLTRIIRIAVNNLAGVPSIVYGVFGLGFFVYFVGGAIDRAFFEAALPSPTFGTGGILWASLTLALLTLPVVIVATEEGLSRIPRSIREGSYALGATKAETLWRTVLPMATPAMMTGLILAIARAAGEVAPLMLVGVVKLAPSLPLDANFPYLHLERKFMHLGFHIYDVGFQSPNVEAARPLVYATSFLLVLIILLLNLAAIRIRNNLREKYRALEN